VHVNVQPTMPDQAGSLKAIPNDLPFPLSWMKIRDRGGDARPPLCFPNSLKSDRIHQPKNKENNHGMDD